MSQRPRIYVASLADYNAGRLHGRWIDADQPAETIREEITQMLAESSESNPEEWAIHDYENFGDLRLSEFEDIDRIAETAFLMTEYGPVFASLLAYLGGIACLDDARRHIEDGYRGEYSDLAEYVAQFVDDCYADVIKDLPDFIKFNVNYDAIARDMQLNGEVFTLVCDGKVHVFDALS